MSRAMGFAGLAMLTMIPLLVVVAAAGAASRHGLARWVVYGMGLNGSSARAVIQLFSAPAPVLGTTSVFGVLLLAVFGVTFAGSVQTEFERVWGLPAGPWHKIWRQTVWLIVLIAYIWAAATEAPVTHHAPTATVSRVSVAVVLGVIFFWWGFRFLIGGRGELPGGDARRGRHGDVPGRPAGLLRLGLQAARCRQRGHLRAAARAGHRGRTTYLDHGADWHQPEAPGLGPAPAHQRRRANTETIAATTAATMKMTPRPLLWSVIIRTPAISATTATRAATAM